MDIAHIMRNVKILNFAKSIELTILEGIDYGIFPKEESTTENEENLKESQ